MRGDPTKAYLLQPDPVSRAKERADVVHAAYIVEQNRSRKVKAFVACGQQGPRLRSVRTKHQLVFHRNRRRLWRPFRMAHESAINIPSDANPVIGQLDAKHGADLSPN